MRFRILIGSCFTLGLILLIQAGGLFAQTLPLPEGFTEADVIVIGESIEGQIDSTTPSVQYLIMSEVGNSARLILTRTSGNYTPSLTVTLEGIILTEVYNYDSAIVSQTITLNASRNGWLVIEIFASGPIAARSATYTLALEEDAIADSDSSVQTIPLPATPAAAISDSQMTSQARETAIANATANAGSQANSVPTVVPSTPAAALSDSQMTSQARETAIANATANAGSQANSVPTVIPSTPESAISNSQMTSQARETAIANATANAGSPVTSTPTAILPTSTPDGQIEPTQPIDDETEILSYGQTLSGELNGTPLSFRFDGDAGEIVSIQMDSDAFDTLLEVYGPSGGLLERDDDTGSGTNAQIGGLRLPETGSYRVTASSYSSSASGAFTILLTDEPIIGTSGSREQDTLTLGESTTGNLNSVEGDLWTFRANPDDLITILMSSTDFDAFLNVYSPDGELIATDDDGGGESNAEIANLRIEDSGDYTVWARSYSPSGSGAYTLTIGTADDFTSAGNSSSGTASGRALDDDISYAEEITGNLPNGDRLSYRFSGSAGDIVTIDLRSSEMDSYLRLATLSGQVLDENDDGGGSLNSQIERYRLPTTGQYDIIVGSYADSGGGRFSLLLTGTAAGSQTSAGSNQIDYGDSVSDFLDGDGITYTFGGSSGDVVTIRLNSDDFDTYLELYDPSNRLIASDDDGGDGLNSRIRSVRLSSTGVYSIVARGYWQPSTGQFSLSLNADQASSSNEVQLVSSQSSGQTDETCGGRTTLFRPGDSAIVDFNSEGSLRLLRDYSAERITTIALAYDNMRVDLLDGPICYANKWYWQAQLQPSGYVGWIAESSAEYRWLCTVDQPECT